MKATVLIIHDSDGKECWTMVLTSGDRQLTEAEKWLIELDCEEATKIITHAANDEQLIELEGLLDAIPEDETKKALGPMSKSWFGSWSREDHISAYSQDVHCVVYIRNITC